MELKTYFAQDRNGSLIPLANVAVYLTGTTTLATGLKKVDGSTLANPFTADADGKIQFYAPDGIYDMQVSLGSVTGVKVTFQCLDVQQQLSGANSAADRAEAAAEQVEGQAEIINELIGSKGFLVPGGQIEKSYDLRAFVQDGDPSAPDYTQALKRAITSGYGRVYVNVPCEITEDMTIPRLFRVDVGPNGYLFAPNATVRIEGFINSFGGNDPYRNYILPYAASGSSSKGIYLMNVTVNIPEDYPTMQDAIDAIPDNYWQFITLRVSDGNYDEDLVIRNKRGCTPNFPPASGQQAIIVITSKSADRTKVSYRSAQVFSCGGTPYSPNLQNINFTNRTHSDEDCSVEFYGCTSGAVNRCSFNGIGVDKCVEAYNSIISVESCDFGNEINDKAMVVKHGGTIMSNSTRVAPPLPQMSGVLKSWVAVAIGGTIIANDLGMCIGKVAQSRVDGVQAGVIIETATKSIDGVTSSFRLATTKHHTQFQDYDKFTYSHSGSGSTITYYPTGGLVLHAGNSDSGLATVLYRRERRLVNMYETTNYLGFAIAMAKSGDPTVVDCLLCCGGFDTGNYFGIKYTGGVASGVIASDGNVTEIPLIRGQSEGFGSWTCKYLGKSDGQVIFSFNDEYAGHINGVKLKSYNGTYFEARTTRGGLQLYELEFVSSK